MPDPLKFVQDLAEDQQEKYIDGLVKIEKDILKGMLKFYDDNHITNMDVAWTAFVNVISNAVGRNISTMVSGGENQDETAKQLLECLTTSMWEITHMHVKGSKS